jgi:DNA-binding NarL/FixJ family response regulator
MRQVRVLLIDGQPVFRYGLRTLLLAEGWVADVVEAPTVADGRARAVAERFELVTMDPSLPDGDVVGAVQSIHQAHPDTGVLILTMVKDHELTRRALRAGARGVLSKAEEPDVLVDALRTIARGGVVLGPGMGTSLLHDLRDGSAAPRSPLDKLTPREREILAHLAAGATNGQIARHLGVSDKTIRNSLSMIMTKLGTADRVQAALTARDAGLIAAPSEQPAHPA